MGSAVLSLMVFLGVILILRSILFGVIPHLKNKKRKNVTSEKEDISVKKEQD